MPTSPLLQRTLQLLSAVVFTLAADPAAAQSTASAVGLHPANQAVDINPDTLLSLSFAEPPLLGTSGQIRIYDAADHRLVDTLDLSVPAGPDPTHRIALPADAIDPNPATPTTTTPAVRTTPADLHRYQLNTIGGLADFHFYPVIIRGKVATIYPHNQVLQYKHSYIVQIDPGVLLPAAGSPDAAFAGFSSDKDWTFSTKAASPAADAHRLVVASDGSGDFNTVQGALDFVPDHPLERLTIFIRNGRYEEIVFFRGKSNLTLRGEDRDKVQIGYGNNSAFNPPMPGPSRRSAFSVYDSTDITLSNFSVSNFDGGQAEGLLIYGSHNIVDRVNIKGSGDALNLRGSVYLNECRIIGDGDTILGVGPAFFNHCEIQSARAYMWMRNTGANHGNVFVNSTFITHKAAAAYASAQPDVAVLARLPSNHGLNYPEAEVVLINCRMKGIPPEGWGPLDGDTSRVRFWEFHSTDLDGHPVDTRQRHPASRQLAQPQDAEIIANYSRPAFVLGGWTPVVE